MGNGLTGEIREMNRYEIDSDYVICYQCYTNQSPFKHLNPCPVIEAKKRLKLSLGRLR